MHNKVCVNNCINTYGKLRKKFLLFLENHFDLEILEEKNRKKYTPPLVTEQPKRNNPFLLERTPSLKDFCEIHIHLDNEDSQTKNSSVDDEFEIL